MATPRRQIIRPSTSSLSPSPQLQRQLARLRSHLERDHTALARWQKRLSRAFNAVVKLQKSIARTERLIHKKENP